MKKISILFVTIVLFFTGCQETSDTSIMTLQEVLSALEEEQLSLREIDISSNNIFGMKLHGTLPSSYNIDGKTFLIYVFSSTEEREKGLEDFRKKTEDSNTVSYKVYEVKNMLFFYVFESDLSEEINNKIQNGISKLTVD
ncbi:hypothetical protein [Bacillus sp. SM2101]|uniref:hypothetical protein n=1 Tax=Bacillus sp. SM2101 TaxID=2805366 RepID=UPI001BDEF9DC|nr:hypothetical protein [Bacillus sp. SM2101]